MLNCNSTNRANQNGLAAFAEFFHQINPEIYIETHVSNGDDYQYTLTHLTTQHNKLRHGLGKFTEDTFRPELEENIRAKNLLITPYVNVFGRTPNSGFSQFFDAARYSTGYTALWNTLGLMIETQMLKPYKQRVSETKSMLESIIQIFGKYKDVIQNLRHKNFESFENDNYYHFNYAIDSTQYNILNFKGYKAEYVESEVTNQPRLKYYADQPQTFPINYYNQYSAQDSIQIPDYYVISKVWKKVSNRLKQNKVEFQVIENDTIIDVKTYKIEAYDTYNSPYEGHYPHYNNKVKTISEKNEL